MIPTSNSLETVIRDAGEGWLLDWFSPPKGAIEHLRGLLRQADVVSHRRFGKKAPPITEKAVIEGYRRSPHKMQAFLQALGVTKSPDLLVMVWRILRGMEIAEVSMGYRQRESFVLSVKLKSPYGEPEEEYHSDNINDAALLRNFGIMTMGDKPIFDGFYAVRIR